MRVGGGARPAETDAGKAAAARPGRGWGVTPKEADCPQGALGQGEYSNGSTG